jgi:hypothetical protein
VHEENQTSSNFYKRFTDKKGEEVHAEQYWTKFQNPLKQPIIGTLHLQFEFPFVQGGTPKSEVVGDDILVFIDCDNLHQFLPNDRSHDDILQIIKYIGKCNFNFH